jgi:hypothetical protein
MDIHEKAIELCHLLANSLYDRNPDNPNPVFFNPVEVELVENWILGVLGENAQTGVTGRLQSGNEKLTV